MQLQARMICQAIGAKACRRHRPTQGTNEMIWAIRVYVWAIGRVLHPQALRALQYHQDAMLLNIQAMLMDLIGRNQSAKARRAEADFYDAQGDALRAAYPPQDKEHKP